ncbi:MAG: NAD(P)H-dependent oxidoreductase, partial [Spirochaetes bacterium]|nr:NAD(P)H-dependent oxidoreductase [Spirochaetota bacterium]
MKVLAIVGSSKTGNTTHIVQYFEQQLKNAEQFEYLYLSDYPLEFCVGCHNCIFIGEDKCPHYQEVKKIEEKMESADAVILASPGYMFTVTGIMKNFLDHVAYNCHRPKYFKKKVYLLAACTKWLADSVFKPMETWATSAGFTLVGKTHIEMLPLPLNEQELEKRRRELQIAASKFDQSFKAKERSLKLSDLMTFHIFRLLA